mmetsp:Transcript_113104/g.259205  ORF Transcript_113104/g.259205 Transcript_113104/m.259205 type:complete len:228 (+) Transcript_113104:947-1630(+)
MQYDSGQYDSQDHTLHSPQIPFDGAAQELRHHESDCSSNQKIVIAQVDTPDERRHVSTIASQDKIPVVSGQVRVNNVQHRVLARACVICARLYMKKSSSSRSKSRGSSPASLLLSVYAAVRRFIVAMSSRTLFFMRSCSSVLMSPSATIDPQSSRISTANWTRSAICGLSVSIKSSDWVTSDCAANCNALTMSVSSRSRTTNAAERWRSLPLSPRSNPSHHIKSRRP